MDNLTEKIAIGFVKQILQALQYLHECNVVHLDLKVNKVQVFHLDGDRYNVILEFTPLKETLIPYIFSIVDINLPRVNEIICQLFFWRMWMKPLVSF